MVVFAVFALSHLGDVEGAREPRFDLDAAEQQDVVEQEGEPAEIGALGESGDLVGEEGGAAGGADEAAERPEVGGQPPALAGSEAEFGDAGDEGSASTGAGRSPRPLWNRTRASFTAGDPTGERRRGAGSENAQRAGVERPPQPVPSLVA
jgi:hypothetical protein